ncbi:MAG: DUF2807 domain-containing protein [Bacteroidetes bacterium]|nr:DUF2807 domain-containing protein [Bacteroidota bacterium]
MFHYLRKNIFLLLIASLLVTCKKENLCDCFKGTGKQTSEERSLAAFNQVYVQDEIDVHLTEGSEYKIKVEAGKQVIKLVKTIVKDGVLTISDDNKCDFTRSYKRKVIVYLTLPKLRKIENNGLGDVYMDSQFTCDTLNYYMSNSGNLHLNLNADIVYGGMHGNGDVYMKGLVNESSVFAGGQGYFYGFDAVAQKMILTLNTSGRMEVNVNSFMKIDMFERSTGDIHYKGNPSSIWKATFAGKGKLIDKN